MKTIVFCLTIIAYTASGQDYFPLEKGNKWTFSVTIPFESNNTRAYTTTVLKELYLYKGIEYFQTQTTSNISGEIEMNFLRVDEKGNTLSLDLESSKESMVIPSTLELGGYWSSIDGSQKYEIINLNESFVTPIKKYNNCIVVKSFVEGSTAYYNYYSKDIGYVGSRDESDSYLLFLSKYKLR